MTDAQIELGDIHWLMDILQNIDVGLLVLDREYHIQLWNGFMESHSGISPQVARDQNLFELFPDLPEQWFRQKAEPVFTLKTRTFTIWEQRPCVFRFSNYRPITGIATFMYQNTTFIPLESVDRSVNHICVIIYDVTDSALNRQEIHRQQRELVKLQMAEPHTGLTQPDAWQRIAANELARCHRLEKPGCLVMLDQLDSLSAHQKTLIMRAVGKLLRGMDLATSMQGRIAILLCESNAQEGQYLRDRLMNLLGKADASLPGQLESSLCEANSAFRDIREWLGACQPG